jgi:hypothetical protein
MCIRVLGQTTEILEWDLGGRLDQRNGPQVTCPLLRWKVVEFKKQEFQIITNKKKA